MLAHNPSSWKTFSVSLKWGINDVLEFGPAFYLKDRCWKLKEDTLGLKKNLVNNAEDWMYVFAVVCCVANSYEIGPKKVTDKDLWYALVIDTVKVTKVRRFMFINYLKILLNFFCTGGTLFLHRELLPAKTVLWTTLLWFIVR